MWAAVRQRTEGAIKALPFRHSGCVRPGFIQPGPGIRSQVRAYQVAIVMFTPLFPLFVRTLPGSSPPRGARPRDVTRRAGTG